MPYHVPQFLEVEDKLFGFFTLRQFLYVFGGLAVAYIAKTYLHIFLAYPIILAVIPFSFAMAFAKINNRPFIFLVDAFLHYIASPRLYIWKKIPKKQEEKKTEEEKNPLGVYVPPMSQSKLKDLSWSLDIKERQTEEEPPKANHSAPLLKDI